MSNQLSRTIHQNVIKFTLKALFRHFLPLFSPLVHKNELKIQVRSEHEHVTVHLDFGDSVRGVRIAHRTETHVLKRSLRLNIGWIEDSYFQIAAAMNYLKKQGLLLVSAAHVQLTLWPCQVIPAFRLARTHFIRRKNDLSNSTLMFWQW